MFIKASATLRNDYPLISDLAKRTGEPIYITKNGEGDGVFMSIEAFEKREELLKMRERVFLAEEERLSGAKTSSTEEVRKLLKQRAKNV